MPKSAAWRARRYLLLPMLPIFGLIGLLVLGLTAAVLPDPVAMVAVPIAWLGSLYHAAKYARRGWVVALAVAWPVLIPYWIYVALGLDRS